MGLNITHTMNNLQFENKESLKNTARDILSRQGAAKNSMQSILNQTLFGAEKVATDIFINPQLEDEILTTLPGNHGGNMDCKCIKQDSIVYLPVFHEGGLVQRGSHEELMEQTEGMYYKLWSSQAQYYQIG